MMDQEYFIFCIKDQRNRASDIIAQLLAEKKYLEDYVKHLEDKLQEDMENEDDLQGRQKKVG